jgi:hypothetical protein
MRALCLSVALLVSLPACALPVTSPHGPGRYDSGALRARLLPAGIGGISFQVNHPAYVALFEMNPGGGVSLLYPRFADDERAVYAGVHSVWRSWSHHDRHTWGGFASPISAWGGRSGGLAQPRIFYLIASERPLRVSSFIGRPLSLRAALGSSVYTASPYALMDDIARLVVPSYLDDDWTTDVFLQWPEPPHQVVAPLPTHVIQCRDGRRYVVPWYVQSCPQDAPTAPPLAWDTAAPPLPGEPQPGEPQRPDRRRPERGDPTRGGDPGEVTRPDWQREPRAADPEAGDRGREARPPTREPGEPRPERPERVRPERERPEPPPAREAPQPAPPPREAPPAQPAPAEPRPMPRDPPPRIEPAPRPESASPQREAPRPEPPS